MQTKPLLLAFACALLAHVGFSEQERIDPLAGTPEGERVFLWPDGKIPDCQTNQCNQPFIEWFVPTNRTTSACFILTCGGGYYICNWTPSGNGSTKLRDYFLEKGMTVVRFHHRTPRPLTVAKHLTAWQDAQRAVRLVRSDAAAHGVDPERIGFLGYSAAGHLALLAATSSQTPAYAPIDELDKVPCHVNWAVPLYPAYVLSDGLDGENKLRGEGKGVELSDLFKFDAKTCPLLFLHGDADAYSPLASVRVYERLHKMNIPAELHILARRGHDFFGKGARPGTPSATWKDRIWEWLVEMEFL